MLSFASVSEMEEQIRDLIEMNQEGLNAWYEDRGFESQYVALYKASEGIENATTLAEAEAVKDKYSEYFLYNDNPADEDLYNPYLPNENSSYAYVCNIRGEVRIGGVVKNFNTIKRAEDTEEYKLLHNTTRGVVTDTNYLKSTVGDRKFWAEANKDVNDFVTLKLTAHKKTLFGWNKYKTMYFIRVDRIVSNWEGFSDVFLYYFNSGEAGLWTNELPSGSGILIGRVKYQKTATMNLYVYSRGTGEEGAGTLKIKYASTRSEE